MQDLKPAIQQLEAACRRVERAAKLLANAKTTNATLASIQCEQSIKHAKHAVKLVKRDGY